MTPAAQLSADLKANFKGQNPGPGNPWQGLLPRLYDALGELDRRQQEGPSFIAIERVKW